MVNDNSILFPAQVLDTNDPMMLGRIRAVRLIDNLDDILRGVTDPPWDEVKDIWTNRDPLIFNTLLPYFVYSTPKKDELVQVIYLNKDFRYQNQFYVQASAFSSPTSTYKEFYFGGNKWTGQGAQIVNPNPLKNQDGTFKDRQLHAGVFPQPGDNAILGRGSADLIVKQDEVLLRAGKFQEENLQPNVLPVGNPKRAFLQLSRFQTTKEVLPPKTYFELIDEVVLVKYLVEWVLINPENTKDNFTGDIFLYQLKPDPSTNSRNLTIDSEVSSNLKVLVYKQEIKGGYLDIIDQINAFISACNNTNFFNGYQLFPDNLDSTKFPLFYRPTNSTFAKMNPSTPSGLTSTVEINNLSKIFKSIKVSPGIKGGYGLIYTKNNVGTVASFVKKTVPQSRFVTQQATYGAVGGDKVFLLSHKSAIPNRGGPINFDNTLYGISPDQFGDEIVPKTSSMVRGEELLELINLIVQFLVTHTHAFPGLPPVPVTLSGVNVASLTSELQNAVNKILNENIRLN
jgi:hypothetical protein